MFPENEISSVDEGNCNIIPVCVKESSDISKDSDVNKFGITELSTERVQSISQIISGPLQQPSMSFALVSGTDIQSRLPILHSVKCHLIQLLSSHPCYHFQ